MNAQLTPLRDRDIWHLVHVIVEPSELVLMGEPVEHENISCDNVPAVQMPNKLPYCDLEEAT